MNQLPQVNLHLANRVLLFLHGLFQFFQVNPVLHQRLRVSLMLLLQRFQIHHGLLILGGAFLGRSQYGFLRFYLCFKIGHSPQALQSFLG